MPSPGPKLSDREARAYARLAPALKHPGPSFGLTLDSETARTLLAALDELSDRRPPFVVPPTAGRAATTDELVEWEAGAIDKARDRVRAQQDAAAEQPLTVQERADAIGQRLDFTIAAGSNLEIAELARAYVELKRLAPLADLTDELAELEDTRDPIVEAAQRIRDVIVEHGIRAEHFTGRLEPLGVELNTLGEALDVHESA